MDFSIDGVDDNRLDVNGPTQPVIQESVAEFTILTNQFGAEYGHSAGGQFNIVTKSGTNDWHGSAWWYNRNRDLDAATNQEKTAFTGTGDVKNRFDYNREGGSVGGPIKRNRLFIYGAYEFQGEGLGAQGATVTMPTAAGIQQLNALNPDAAVAAILKEFPAAPTKSGTTIVDGTHIDIGQVAGVAPNFSNQHDFTINSDLNLGAHQLRARVLYDRFRAPQVNPIQPQSQFTGTQQSDARKVIFTDAWSISSRFINDFRASYSRLNGPGAALVPTALLQFPQRRNRCVWQQRRPEQSRAAILCAKHLPTHRQPQLHPAANTPLSLASKVATTFRRPTFCRALAVSGTTQLSTPSSMISYRTGATVRSAARQRFRRRQLQRRLPLRSGRLEGHVPVDAKSRSPLRIHHSTAR